MIRVHRVNPLIHYDSASAHPGYILILRFEYHFTQDVDAGRIRIDRTGKMTDSVMESQHELSVSTSLKTGGVEINALENAFALVIKSLRELEEERDQDL